MKKSCYYQPLLLSFTGKEVALLLTFGGKSIKIASHCHMYGFEAFKIMPSTQYGTLALALVEDTVSYYTIECGCNSGCKNRFGSCV